MTAQRKKITAAFLKRIGFKADDSLLRFVRTLSEPDEDFAGQEVGLLCIQGDEWACEIRHFRQSWCKAVFANSQTEERGDDHAVTERTRPPGGAGTRRRAG